MRNNQSRLHYDKAEWEYLYRDAELKELKSVSTLAMHQPYYNVFLLGGANPAKTFETVRQAYEMELFKYWVEE